MIHDMTGFHEYPGPEFVGPDGSRWTRQDSEVANYDRWSLYTSPDWPGVIVWENYGCEGWGGFTWYEQEDQWQR